MTTEKLDCWAIVEIMGHQTYAGKVCEQEIGGTAFVRVDVPEISAEYPAFTKIFGAASIYCITPCSEQVAMLRAAAIKRSPMSVYDLPESVRKALQQKALPAPEVDEDEDYEDDYSPLDHGDC